MKEFKYFDYNEFFRSRTAEETEGADKIINYPRTEKAVKEVRNNISMLVNMVLDPLRELIGHPIYVSSGYRCKELNKAVGGVKNSQHLTGEAADITTNDYDGNMVMAIELLTQHSYGEMYPDIYDEDDEAKNLEDGFDFDQMILYRQTADKTRYGWIHVSYRNNGKNRHEVIDCYKGVYKKLDEEEQWELLQLLAEYVTLENEENKYQPNKIKKL